MVAYAVGSARRGIINKTGSRNRDGHREYRLETRVEVTDPQDDGPQIVMNAVGLPTVGSFWKFGNDVDPWAFCLPTMDATPELKSEPSRFWKVVQTFSTLPMTRCQDTSIEDPLLEPPRISGSFSRYTKEVFKDKDDEEIFSSSFERLYGLERDYNRPSVQISMNYVSVSLPLIASMINTVNDDTLWGLEARKVKLADVSWTRQLYSSCYFFYTINYEFEINHDTWDISDAVDTGYKVYNAASGKPKTDPSAFVIYTDDHDHPTKGKIPLHDGEFDTNPPHYLPKIELYKESNFLLLGIPSTF